MAIREDEIAAKAMGINTRNIKLLASPWARRLAARRARCSALSRVLCRLESFVLWESIYILAIVVLGGMGHIPGVILGGILLVGFQELLRARRSRRRYMLFGHTIVDAEVLRQLLFGLALVGVMLYRPAACGRRPAQGRPAGDPPPGQRWPFLTRRTS
ncbi:ABC transporter permease subunit [Cupriavidus basilensis]